MAIYVLYLHTQLNKKTMTIENYNNKANELNSKFPNLKAEVTTGWNGILEIKVCNSDKAKTLKEMYKDFNFTF